MTSIVEQQRGTLDGAFVAAATTSRRRQKEERARSIAKDSTNALLTTMSSLQVILSSLTESLANFSI